MGRPFYIHHVREDALPAWEALGWVELGRRVFGLGEVSVTIEWIGEHPPAPSSDACTVVLT